MTNTALKLTLLVNL